MENVSELGRKNSVGRMETFYFLNVMGFFGRAGFFLSLEPPNDCECQNSDPLDPKP